jgi:hypothetical protein
MLLDFRRAREKVINFFRDSSIAGALFLQPLNVSVDDRNLGRYVAQAIMHYLKLLVGSSLQLIIRVMEARRFPGPLFERQCS